MRDFISAIGSQFKREEEELKAAEEITEIVFPKIDKLERRDIINPVILKTKLAKLNREYRDAVYGLCRIATDGGPEGSVIVLDPEKVLSMLEDIEVEETYSTNPKSKKKFIVGFTKKIANAIRSLALAKLAALCHLINDLVIRKIVNTPSPEKLKAAAVHVSSLVVDRAHHR
jgi:hypothetical protein